MAEVLPVCELVQGRPILQSTEFPPGPQSKYSAKGGLDHKVYELIIHFANCSKEKKLLYK